MIDDLKDCYCFKVNDNAMLPILQPGDEIFFRLESWEPEEGEAVVLVDADNHAVVRRYKRDKGFIGDNPDTPPIDARDMRTGKILQAWRPLPLSI